MDEREVPYSDLTDEIARRTALNWDPAVPEVRTEFIVAEMTNRARDLLVAGRTAEASVLFEFAVHQWPADARARNNLGFCLIPLDPARALTHLNAAARDRYAPLGVNVYNRMCCHVSLRQPRAVLDLAEQWWSSRDPSEDDVIAILWTRSHEGWQLDTSAVVKGAITALAIATACVHGWSDDEQVWRKRSSGEAYPSR
ncbi:hypothetical protein AB0K60_33730 [Thermopolyspora sp. NPDC052614]|uniref:hypothetical protein n=1 Tax=Thermopolyspora sp. NPDC052614 TaxID=3155682 RepID=UPI00341C18EB